MQEIIEAIGISRETVIKILHEKLSLKMLSARWVPRILTAENKHNRVTDSMAARKKIFHTSCTIDSSHRRKNISTEPKVHGSTAATLQVICFSGSIFGAAATRNRKESHQSNVSYCWYP